MLPREEHERRMVLYGVRDEKGHGGELEAAEWTAWELWERREANVDLIKRALLGDHEAAKL